MTGTYAKTEKHNQFKDMAFKEMELIELGENKSKQLTLKKSSCYAVHRSDMKSVMLSCNAVNDSGVFVGNLYKPPKPNKTNRT